MKEPFEASRSCEVGLSTTRHSTGAPRWVGGNNIRKPDMRKVGTLKPVIKAAIIVLLTPMVVFCLRVSVCLESSHFFGKSDVIIDWDVMGRQRYGSGGGMFKRKITADGG